MNVRSHGKVIPLKPVPISKSPKIPSAAWGRLSTYRPPPEVTAKRQPGHKGRQNGTCCQGSVAHDKNKHTAPYYFIDQGATAGKKRKAAKAEQTEAACSAHPEKLSGLCCQHGFENAFSIRFSGPYP